MPTDSFNSHALLSRLKTAAALALLENRAGAITEEDWELAGVVHAVSDHTRRRVIDVLEARARDANAARAVSEGRREVIKGSVVEEDEVKRVCQAILKALRKADGDWVTGSTVRSKVARQIRHHFTDAVDLLAEAGQIEAEELEYRSQAGVRIRLSDGVK